MARVIEFSALNPSRFKRRIVNGEAPSDLCKGINIRMKALTFEKLILNL
jgi:hypothetical protein